MQHIIAPPLQANNHAAYRGMKFSRETFTIYLQADSDGQGIVLINDVALNSGAYQFQDIYKNTPTNTLVTKVNGGNTLIISQVEPTNTTPNRIIINNWTETNNLSINLTGSAPTPTGNVLNGDFKKKIDTKGTPDTSDDEYILTNGNYTQDGTEAGAKDLITGTGFLGTDVITDSDGQGVITINNNPPLSGGNQVTGTDYVWESADHKTLYTKYDQGDGKFTLNITLENGEKIFVKDWVNGQYETAVNDLEWRVAA